MENIKFNYNVMVKKGVMWLLLKLVVSGCGMKGNQRSGIHVI